jgi:hypothetical protein
MSFDRPQGLWILALALPVVLSHFYRGRRRRLAVPLLAFWEQVLIEEDRRSALRRLRHRAALLLALLAIGLLAWAASGPRVPGWTREPLRWALVFDGAPRLQSPGRSERMLEEAVAFLRSRAAEDRVSSPDPRIPWTSDLQGAERALRAGWPPAELDPARRVREALAAGPDVRAVVFSDRRGAATTAPIAPERVRHVVLPDGGENAGWTAGRRQGSTIELVAEAFGDRPRLRQEVLLFNGRELARRPIELVPGEPAERAWTLDPKEMPGATFEDGGLLEVLLEPLDGFPADDVASFVLPPRAPPPVLVFHGGSPSALLMHSLDTLRRGGKLGPEIAALPAEDWPAWKSKLGEQAVVIFDRAKPASEPDRGLAILVGVPGPGRTVERPRLVDWDRHATPLERVDLGGVVVRAGRILEGSALIEAAEGPLATWSSAGGFARLELGFALEDSDLAARPAWLLLLLNLVEAWKDGLLRSFPLQASAGRELAPVRPLWFRDGELRAIQSERASPVAVREGRLAAPLRPQPGFTRLSAGGRSEWIAANLFDAAQSDLRPPPGGATPPAPTPAAWWARWPSGALATLAGLLLLLVEALLWARGWI